ncbi:MAG: VWA domain-containing protein [Kiritimatiellaeota bacterium]|nr:VWA domain-containing protein [Kiritimatiellota bacterium]
MKSKLSVTLVLFAAAAFRADATGMMIPADTRVPPLAIKYQRVTVDVRDLVAWTVVRQAFQNSTSRPLEATYVFPLPLHAAVTEFSMVIDGKRIKGELLDKDKAARIYRDVVRRMRDPGLLEYLGGHLFRAKVFPIPPHAAQEVEIRYSQVVARDGGICRYVYPLRTGERSSRVREDFTVSVRIRSRQPIKTVYSPSHEIDAVRKTDHEAVAGFEAIGQALDRDFLLYWTVSDKDFGVNLLTRRPEKDKDGWFMLMLSPKVEFRKEEVAAKDMVFVLDTSGSMSRDNKIGQAKDALLYCVANLRKTDRFNIVRFSTDVDSFRKKLAPATASNIEAARQYIRGFPARGGTDINSALLRALSMKTDGPRPFVVVFLTDGLPTVGTTAPQRILDNVKRRYTTGVRIFCFGVGYDVNTHLLDQLAACTRATVEYARPKEDIELKVSLFFDKASEPVLSNPELDFGSIPVSDVYPKLLPDVFKGSQLLVFGRYRGSGETAIRLRGDVNGKKRVLVYEDRFPQQNSENEFIERLWATRKVGYLLDEIRLNGEKTELRDEVVRLSREYGIMTPYTSYLVMPDTVRSVARTGAAGRPPRPRSPQTGGRMLSPMGEAPGGAPAGAAGGGNMWSGAIKPRGTAAAKAPFARLAEAAGVRVDMADRLRFEPGADGMGGVGLPAQAFRGASVSGRAAVELSSQLSRLKTARREDAGDGRRPMRALRGKVFYRIGQVWIDAKFAKTDAVLRLRYASDAYFKLLEVRPDLKPWLMLGDKVIIVLKAGFAVRIGDNGKETLDKTDLARLRQ